MGYNEDVLNINRKIALGIVALLFLVPNIGIWTVVSAGHVGVITRFGAVNRVIYPGIAIKIPLIESMANMETRTQKEQVEATAASNDLQEVRSTIALNYHLNGEKAVEVYQNIGTSYRERVVDPAMQEAFKAVTAQFTAEDLITKREKVREITHKELKNRLEKYNVIVDDLNIVNFEFSKDFNMAIEQKQVAQQNLERAKIEAETAKTQANGQATAQQILRNGGSLSTEYLQFLAVQKWDGKLPNATNGVPFLNIPTR